MLDVRGTCLLLSGTLCRNFIALPPPPLNTTQYNTTQPRLPLLPLHPHPPQPPFPLGPSAHPLFPAPQTCSGHGVCQGSGGYCSCFFGYDGPACTDCGPVHQRVQGGCVFLPGALASCSDGTRNGGETGVDCGGSCAPCPVPPKAAIAVRGPESAGGRGLCHTRPPHACAFALPHLSRGPPPSLPCSRGSWLPPHQAMYMSPPPSPPPPPL